MKQKRDEFDFAMFGARTILTIVIIFSLYTTYELLYEPSFGAANGGIFEIPIADKLEYVVASEEYQYRKYLHITLTAVTNESLDEIERYLSYVNDSDLALIKEITYDTISGNTCNGETDGYGTIRFWPCPNNNDIRGWDVPPSDWIGVVLYHEIGHNVLYEKGEHKDYYVVATTLDKDGRITVEAVIDEEAYLFNECFCDDYAKTKMELLGKHYPTTECKEEL